MNFPHKVPPGVSAFLALVDRVVFDDSVPTSATALEKGRLTLILGKMWQEGSEATQAELLTHEATHFYCNHFVRLTRQEVINPIIWNLATDAAIHFSGGCHQGDCWAVTWERLGLTPTTVEDGYKKLLERADTPQLEGCGSIRFTKDDGSVESMGKAMQVCSSMGRSKTYHGEGAYIELAPPPPWIRQCLHYLLSSSAVSDRARSWRREHRLWHEMPGMSRRRAQCALFLIDSSASISDEDLSVFLGAVMSTPELAASSCVIFDTEPSPIVPVSQAQRMLAHHGRGGTDFVNAAKLRSPGETAVWLTDGYAPWPEAHDSEIWCITSDVVPPHGIHIKAS